MTPQDLEPFGQLLDATCSLLSRGTYQPNPTNTALFFRALAKYPLDVVRAAFDAHVLDPQRGRFVPVPADLIAQIEGFTEADGRPGVEEAWAKALIAADEAATVVWTEEMADAWAIARPVFALGDEVGARMAFKEAYASRIDAARAKRQPVKWLVSEGHDPEQRAQVVLDAVADGRLSPERALGLPAPRSSAVALLEGNVSGMPESVRAEFQRLRELYTKPPEGPTPGEIAAQATQRLKAQAAERVAEYEKRDHE